VRSGRALLAVFAFAILASAGLLFVAEPMAAKLVLPSLGGAPAVWNGCMLFFQAALLAGYLYAHLLSRLAARTQFAVHAVVLAASAAALPVTLLRALPDPGGHAPMAWLLMALAGGDRAAVLRDRGHRASLAALVFHDRPSGREGPVLPVRRQQPRLARGPSRLPVPHRAATAAGDAAPALDGRVLCGRGRRGGVRGHRAAPARSRAE
jgi:hypothetical protein